MLIVDPRAELDFDKKIDPSSWLDIINLNIVLRKKLRPTD